MTKLSRDGRIIAEEFSSDRPHTATAGGPAPVTTREKAETVRKQRESVYGSPSVTLNQVAAHWTALLRSHFPDKQIPPIPPYMVGLFMATLKIHRMAAPGIKKDHDSYVDAYNYLEFAKEEDPFLPISPGT